MTEVQSLIRSLGRDGNGWQVLQVAPGYGIINVRIGGKKLELVQQPHSVLTVRVNPDPNGLDDWNGILVGSPEVSSEAESDKTDSRSKQVKRRHEETEANHEQESAAPSGSKGTKNAKKDAAVPAERSREH